MELVIGDKTISSWSMRPWLVLKRLGVPFEEIKIRLRQPDTSEQAARYSPSGKVPLLRDDGFLVWDSLAICEYLADKFPDAGLWPADMQARARARSVSCEMHAGFQSIRGELAMDLGTTRVAELVEITRAEVRRVTSMWLGLRETYADQGPFLFGQWSIADAFFTPVATRFRTYGVKLSDFGDHGAAGSYCETLLEQPEFKIWEADAAQERAERAA